MTSTIVLGAGAGEAGDGRSQAQTQALQGVAWGTRTFTMFFSGSGPPGIVGGGQGRPWRDALALSPPAAAAAEQLAAAGAAVLPRVWVE